MDMYVQQQHRARCICICICSDGQTEAPGSRLPEPASKGRGGRRDRTSSSGGAPTCPPKLRCPLPVNILARAQRRPPDQRLSRQGELSKRSQP